MKALEGDSRNIKYLDKLKNDMEIAHLALNGYG